MVQRHLLFPSEINTGWDFAPLVRQNTPGVVIFSILFQNKNMNSEDLIFIQKFIYGVNIIIQLYGKVSTSKEILCQRFDSTSRMLFVRRLFLLL